VWDQPVFTRLGGAIAVCGAAGLLLALIGAGEAAIGVVSGVAPGALLLAAAWWPAGDDGEEQPAPRRSAAERGPRPSPSS